MSHSRQERRTDARSIDAFSRDYRHGHRLPPHRHGTDQLLYAASGTMTVTTDDGAWVIPPQRAVWVPAGTAHGIAMSGSVQMRTLYLARGRAFADLDACRVLDIAPLDRELILELVRTRGSRGDPMWSSLATLLLGRLTSLPVVPLHLPLPRDVRARRVARSVLADPAATASLATLARGSGASERTLARIFTRECAMTFGQWRQRARVLAALRLLAAGQPVTTVALDVGYESPSAFIAMFRRLLGVSPGRYYAPFSR